MLSCQIHQKFGQQLVTFFFNRTSYFLSCNVKPDKGQKYKKNCQLFCPKNQTLSTRLVDKVAREDEINNKMIETK